MEPDPPGSKTRSFFSTLKETLGEEEVAKLQKQSNELQALKNELREIYARQRSLRVLLKGPYVSSSERDGSLVRDAVHCS